MANNGDPQSPQVPADPSLNGRVSVMPGAYLPEEKAGISTKTVLFIIGGLILAVLIGIAVYLYVQQSLPPQQADQQQDPAQQMATTGQQQEDPRQEQQQGTDEQGQEDTQGQQAEDAANQPEQEQQDVGEGGAQQDQEPIIEEETGESAITIPTVVSGTVQTSEDTDQDGLTDVEEQLFATSTAVPDTDEDSFLDGSEMLNLYDPASPGALLEVSPNVKIARNETRGYQMLIPVNWSASRQTPDGDIFTIVPENGTEQMSVRVYENPDRQSVVQWYQEQVPGADLNQFANFSNEAGWSGILSNDKRLAFATYGEEGAGARAFIYVFFYDVGNEEQIRFPTVWQTMLNSLTVAETSGAEQQNAGGQQPNSGE